MSQSTQPDHDPQAWPQRDRINALRRVYARAQIQDALDDLEPDARRCPRLPSWLLLLFVIALSLFPNDNYRQVFRYLAPRRFTTPGRSTLAMGRTRLGAAPLRRFAERVVRPLGKRQRHPRAFWRGLRLLGVDGFKLDLPDSPANAAHFGRPKGGRTPGAFPQIRVVAFCELGTHVLWRWRSGPLATGETTLAHELFPLLPADTLILGDRAYGNFPVVEAVRARKAHVLARLKSTSLFKQMRRLEDGSFLSKIYKNQYDRKQDRNGIEVRIVRYRLGKGKAQRLLTTLLDVAQGTAAELVELYHSRWEEETALDELKTHLLEKAGLRSQTVEGVEQEVEGLLLAHYLIRVLMVEAADAAGVDPTRISFVGALKILKCRLPECKGGARVQARWLREVIAEIAEEEVLPERRLRRNPRQVRQKMSKWPKKPPKKRRPRRVSRPKLTLLR